MRLLRDRWRRTAFAKYFEGLDTVDRVTFLIGTVLALAAGCSAQAIVRTWWQ